MQCTVGGVAQGSEISRGLRGDGVKYLFESAGGLSCLQDVQEGWRDCGSETDVECVRKWCL